jgi:hypothetical protein
MEPTITCPHCQGEVKLTETIAAPLLAAERSKIEETAKQRAALLDQRQRALESQASNLKSAETSLAESRAELDRLVAEKVLEAREAVALEERAKAQSAVEAELTAARDSLDAKTKALAIAQEAELEVRRQRETLEAEKREFDLRLQRTLDEQRQSIREETQREDDERYRLKLAEKDKVLADMKKQLEEARRTGDQGSQQLQGEVQELDLESILRAQFPLDDIQRVPKGQNGADILQHVVDVGGRRCGSILWETKRTKNWNDQWLPKLRDDQREAGAEIAAITSTALPSGVTNFGEIDGVWVTGPSFTLPVAAALRKMVIDVASARQAVAGHQDKVALMYDYLTGSQFRQRVEAIAESFIQMQEDLAAEKRATLRQWAKREKQLHRMVAGTAGLYGDVQGIAGAALPTLESLELLESPRDDRDEQDAAESAA